MPLGHGADCTPYQLEELERLQAKQWVPAIEGHCENCGRGLLVGEVTYVAEWESFNWGNGFQVMQARVRYCFRCREAVPVSENGRYIHRRRRRRGPIVDPDEEQEEKESVPNAESLSVKDIAVRIVSVMSKDQAAGSKKLAKLAGLDYEEHGETILTILHKLQDAGKVEFEDGRWRLL